MKFVQITVVIYLRLVATQKVKYLRMLAACSGKCPVDPGLHLHFDGLNRKCPAKMLAKCKPPIEKNCEISRSVGLCI